MLILIITQLFDPEPNYLRGLDYARALVAEGHDVEVLTGYPNYPSGELYEGFRMRWWEREVIEGVSVIRVAMFPARRSGFLRRVLNYLSLSFSICFPGMLLVRRPDLVHIYQGPATLFLPALIGRVFGWRYLIDLQDLWPESLSCSLPSSIIWLTHPVEWWCQLAYKFSDHIVVQSEGYRDKLTKLDVPQEKIDVIYNWADESDNLPHKHRGNEVGILELVYAGNFGPFQGLETVLEAAGFLNEQRNFIKIVLIGLGAQADSLREKVIRERISNVYFEDWMAKKELFNRLAKTDGLLIHLSETKLTKIAIPSKIQAYLTTGKPIVAAVPGEANALLKNAGVQFVCKPDNPKLLAELIEQFVKMESTERNVYGQRGKDYYWDHLCFRKGFAQFQKTYHLVTTKSYFRS